MALSEGDHVSWNTPQGVTHGVIVDKRITDFHFKGQKFIATRDDPAFIVESEKTGARAAHQGDALTTKD